MSDQRQTALREAERDIIGSLLIDPCAGVPVAEELLSNGAALFFDEHRAIYRKIMELGVNASIDSVAAGLRESKTFKAAGATAFLSSCQDGAPLGVPGLKTSIKLVLREATIRTGQRAAEDYATRLLEDPNAARVALLRHLETAAPTIDRPEIISASDLMRKQLPPTKWAIPGLIPGGLSLLAGKPKIGKSWLSLCLSVAVADGGRALGSIEVSKGSVLYLALEDTERRLQKRLMQLLGSSDAPPGLDLTTAWPRMDAGGLEQIETWIKAHPDARLILVDTLAKLRSSVRSNGDKYAADYAVACEFKRLSDRYGVPFVGICHDRKAEAEDWIDKVNATTGLTGAADTILLLERQRGSKQARLRGVGRDLEEEIDLALDQDPSAGGWVLLGDAQAHLLTLPQKEIVTALAKIGHPSTPAEIATFMGRNVNTVKSLVWRMEEEGKLSVTDGHYAPLSHTTHRTEETATTNATHATAWLEAANVSRVARDALVVPVAG